MYRIALALLRGRGAREERLRDPTGERAPRRYIFDDRFSPVWDETLLDSARTAARGPEWWRLALEIHRRRDEYDAIVTWGERLSLALTAVQRFARGGKPHIAMIGQFAKPNTQLPLRLFGESLHAAITWTSVQRRYLIDRLGFPSERAYLVRHFVDQLFYSPRDAEEDTICSVGAEMRDYPTLIEALRGTDLRCHIAADHMRVPHRIRLVADRRVPLDTLSLPADAKITIGRKTLPELRDLYARSRFVVVPLVPSDSDNGVTVILEAMAMGKPVVCSQTRGQVDIIQSALSDSSNKPPTFPSPSGSWAWGRPSAWCDLTSRNTSSRSQDVPGRHPVPCVPCDRMDTLSRSTTGSTRRISTFSNRSS